MAGRKFHPSAIISSSEKFLYGDTDTPFSSRSASGAPDPLWAPVPAPAFCEPTANLEGATRDGGEDYEGCGFLQLSAKKRRLSPHQVQFLERSFDAENKLEPERKAQIAKELGLQPQQVAVWFQNRRARFKTKQLEKDYGELKDSYDKLKAECDCLGRENEQLKEEVRSLKDKLLLKDQRKEKESSEDKKLDDADIIQDKLPDQKPTLGCKQEEATTSASRSSGVLDSDSPYLTGSSHHGLLLEPANSSHAFGPDCSDFSQEEGDNLEFPRLGHGAAYRYTSSGFGFGFTGELDQQLWSWLH